MDTTHESVIRPMRVVRWILVAFGWLAIAFILLALSEIFLNPPLLAGKLRLRPEMVWRREGQAEVFVSWCRQKELPVALTIYEDGTVEGKIGDATLGHSRIEPNRSWLDRALHWRTDYAIRGDLSGAIVAAESITRHRVSILLNFDGSRFTGAVITSGLKMGGKDTMKLTAGRLKLDKNTKV